MGDSWQATLLNLPPDIEPGVLAPAVLEAYPAAARVVDLALAQRAVCNALEVSAVLRCSISILSILLLMS